MILNSADKIKDVIGMERTVVKTDGNNWFGTDAYSNSNIPLDREMGVGHLNANRAVEQHRAGQFGPGNVPLVGWDYFAQNDPFNPASYILNLNAGDFVSATLVWDRNVFLNSPFLEYQRGDEFIDFGFENLDLELVHVHLGMEDVIASSTSTAWNLEHIFTSVPANGFYHLRVHLRGFESVNVPYTLAWWAGADERTPPGDHNGDGRVDAADYVVWRKSDSSNEGYNDWRGNFGTTYSSGSGFASVPEPSFFMLFCVAIALRGLRSPARGQE